MALNPNPESGVGITLSWKATSGGTYAALLQLRDDCEFGGFDTTVIPVPVLAAGTLAKTPGRTDYGDFTGSCWNVPADAGVVELHSAAASKAVLYWQVQLPDGSTSTTGSTYTFQGFISNLKPGNFTGEDSPTLDFTIAIPTAVTLTPGT